MRGGWQNEAHTPLIRSELLPAAMVRLVTFHLKNETAEHARIGVLVDEATVSDVTKVNDHIPSDMRKFLEGGEAVIAKAREAASHTSHRHAMQDVKILAPIRNPDKVGALVAPGVPALISCKIICVGLNYRDHAAETGAAIPPEPVLFSKVGRSCRSSLLPYSSFSVQHCDCWTR